MEPISTKFKKMSFEDALKVNKLSENILKSTDKKHSFKRFKRNLAYCYHKHTGRSMEESAQIVSRMCSGIETYQTRLEKVNSEGAIDFKAEVEDMCRGKNLEERFNLLLDSLVTVQFVSANAMGDVREAEEIRNLRENLLKKHPNPSEEACTEMQARLAESMENNGVAAACIAKGSELLSAVRESEAKMTDFMSEQRNNILIKNATALAFLIEYEAGHLPSVEEGLLPETIGMACAAAVDEANAAHDAQKALEDGDEAAAGKFANVLKTICGVLLVCAITFAGSLALSLVGAALASSITSIIGASLVGSLVALMVCIPVISILGVLFACGAVYAVDKAGELYDKAVIRIRDTVIPKARETTVRVLDWLREKLVPEAEAEVEETAFVA